MASERTPRAAAVRAAACVLAALVGARAARAQTAGGGPDSAAGQRPGIERLSAVVQQRLQLTDEQTARLRETSQRYADQRQSLLRDERDARRTVRDEVNRGNAADQSRVQGALDRIYAIQQRRSELAAGEQRELATFLTPTQRAQYAGLQERAFRAAQAIRQQRAAGAPAPAGGQPLPIDANRAAQALQAQRRAERQQQQQLLQQQRQAEREARRAAKQSRQHAQ